MDPRERTALKTRENRSRRAAHRQGLEIVKQRREDPRAIDYGSWRVIDATTRQVVAGDALAGLSLAAVEAYLDRGRGKPWKWREA
jgi:hypothetical protein